MFHKYVCRCKQPQNLQIQGIQMEPLSDIPTSRHSEKGQIRTCQPEAEIGWNDQGVYSSIPPMHHQDPIQHRSSWQVPDTDIKKCHKARACEVCGDLPSSINQLRQTWWLGPCPDPGRVDQDQAKGLKDYLDWPFWCLCQVLEHKPSKWVKLCQPKL